MVEEACRRFGHQVAETPVGKCCKGVSATWWPKHLCSIGARACLGTGTKPRVFRPPVIFFLKDRTDGTLHG
ncbi:uncharacterized protein G2W53_033901 [Senna tora]|uniref:Uncharacterized protein n=1 Tax=Senna tora TaxID=362788 RepID=A0A834T1J1_9FABA|nr:uncharacterized protein G2W53_033901 [Senna tora]